MGLRDRGAAHRHARSAAAGRRRPSPRRRSTRSSTSPSRTATPVAAPRRSSTSPTATSATTGSALHGGQRIAIEECVICHNPNASDVSRRPADKAPPRVDRLQADDPPHPHGRGPDAGLHDLRVRHASELNNFNEVRFPGDRRDCRRATPRRHAGTSVCETPPAGLLPTTTPRDWYTRRSGHRGRVPGLPRHQAAAAHAFSTRRPSARPAPRATAPTPTSRSTRCMRGRTSEIRSAFVEGDET